MASATERVHARLLLAASLCLALPAAAPAQVTTADLVGRVTDGTGAVVLAASVTIENLGTAAKRSMAANAEGEFVFNLLPIGRYSLRVEAPKFHTFTVAEVVLAAGDRARVDARLEVGQAAESVEVMAGVSSLQTDSSTMSALVTEKAVQDLPVAGRNFVRLVQLVPGASEGVPNSLASGTRPDDRRQTSAASINGALDNQNNQLIDGMDNNERAIGTIGVKPSIDAIAEIKVQTNLYTAEVGRTAGGVVNVITKSGTNEFHGSAFGFMRNERFDARDFFAPVGQDKPRFRQQQYGGSLGGPLHKDKTFFFVDYEGFHEERSLSNVLTVPTARMRSGDFSELSVPIYDPLSSPRTPFPGNIIPAGRIDPIARHYLDLYPLPTSGGLANNFSGVRERTQDSWTADARIDHRFNETDYVFLRYSYNHVKTFVPGALPVVDGIEPGGNNGLFPGPNTTVAHGAQANYTRIFSPTLLGEVRLGYLRADIQSNPLNYGTNVSEQFGVPNVNIDEFTSALAAVTATGYANLGSASFVPLIQIDDALHANASLTKTKGSHNIKLGLGVVARKFTVFQSSFPVGPFTFDSRLTDNGAGAGGNTIASLLLGYPSAEQRSVSLIYPHYRTTEPSAYVQDDWRATSWLTLNMGLRYDIFTPYREDDDQLSNIDLATSKIIVAGQDGVSRTAGVTTDYGNVAPRLGFAASLRRSTVLRGGFGLTYFPGNYMSQSFMKNPPFISTFGPVNSGGISGGLPTLRFSSGLPVPTATSATNPAGTILGVEPDFKSTRVQQFNVVLEEELGGSVLSVGYVGSRGNHVAFAVPNLNLAPAGPGAVQARRKYYSTLPNVTTIGMFASDFNSYYNALQVTFQRRARQGMTFNANYTLGHSEATSPTPNDPSVIERFDYDNDVRHRGVLTLNWEMPFFRSRHGFGKQVLSGWQLNIVGFWQTGLPFTVTNSVARSNTGAGGDRPNQISDPALDNPTTQQWFDTSAFQGQPLNTIGNTGRNTLHGPSQRRLDVSLFKDFPLGGDWRLQFRAECYNVTNTPSFANPSAALGAPAFGTITSTGNAIPRQVQFGAKLLF